MDLDADRKPYLSLEDSVKDANLLWKVYKDHTKKDPDFRNKDPDKRLSDYQKLFPRFFHSYPIVLRYMIAYEKFYTKAFVKYIKKLQNVPVRSMDERIERYADYVKYLYRETTKAKGMSYDSKYAAELKTDVYQTLLKEKTDFEENYKKSQHAVDKLIEINQQEKRKKLIEYLQHHVIM